MKEMGNAVVALDDAIEISNMLKRYGDAEYYRTKQNEIIRKIFDQKQREIKKEEEKRIKEEKNKERKANKIIIQMDDSGNTIAEYCSVSEAVRETGINDTSIRETIKGNQKHAGGYVWKKIDSRLS